MWPHSNTLEERTLTNGALHVAHDEALCIQELHADLRDLHTPKLLRRRVLADLISAGPLPFALAPPLGCVSAYTPTYRAADAAELAIFHAVAFDPLLC